MPVRLQGAEEKSFTCTPLRHKEGRSIDGGMDGRRDEGNRSQNEQRSEGTEERERNMNREVSLWTGCLFLLQVRLDLGCTYKGQKHLLAFFSL